MSLKSEILHEIYHLQELNNGPSRALNLLKSKTCPRANWQHNILFSSTEDPIEGCSLSFHQNLPPFSLYRVSVWCARRCWHFRISFYLMFSSSTSLARAFVLLSPPLRAGPTHIPPHTRSPPRAWRLGLLPCVWKDTLGIEWCRRAGCCKTLMHTVCTLPAG